jgi:DNA-binding MarR family transcriptional regulator
MDENMKEVLMWLGDWFRTRDYSPTVREVAAGVWMAQSTANGALHRLERDRLIIRARDEDGRALHRSMRITLDGRVWCAVQRLQIPDPDQPRREFS